MRAVKYPTMTAPSALPKAQASMMPPFFHISAIPALEMANAVIFCI